MTLFKHEFIMSIWLSEKGLTQISANRAKIFTSRLELLTMVKMCLVSTYKLQIKGRELVNKTKPLLSDQATVRSFLIIRRVTF